MDIQNAYNEANETFTDLINEFSAIDEGKINTVPFAGSWTAGQLAQHIVLSAGGFNELLNGPVKDTDRDPEANVQQLRTIFLDLNTKFKSPDFIVPGEKQYNKQELLDTLQGIKESLLTGIKTLDTTKTCTLFELPGSGHITSAEAMTFAIVHTKRHVYQLKNISKHL